MSDINDVNLAVCRKLGIDPNVVDSITIDFRVHGAPVVTVRIPYDPEVLGVLRDAVAS